LYVTRDGEWIRGRYKPGNTTMGEAQLIGRGARYFPFQLDEVQDKYKRKFDDDIENELRIIETLHYHCFHEPRYIQEIKSTLTEMGILPEKYVQKELFVKESFKKTKFWKEGVIFINDRIKNSRTEIFGLQDAKIKDSYYYELKTGELKEEIILDERESSKTSTVEREIVKYKLIDFGKNIIRSALDRLEFYKFDKLKKYFPNLQSIEEFISSQSYLGNIEVEISGPKNKVKNLNQEEKLKVALYIAKEIAEQARINISEYKGSTEFKARMLSNVFRDKFLKLDSDDERVKGMQSIDLQNKDWYAQNELYGTSEEKEFIEFINSFIEKLKEKYSDVVLFRNEKFFQIFDFDEGRPFEPDFVLFLKNTNQKILTYQIFIEPKGDQFKDRDGRFENSKEGWKQKFLLEIEEKGEIQKDLFIENKHFKLLGLPFYNKKLENEFKDALNKKILI
jgi:type III restriction enzyme